MKFQLLGAPKKSTSNQSQCLNKQVSWKPRLNSSVTSNVKLARKQRQSLHFMANLVINCNDPVIVIYFFPFLTLSYAYSKKLLNKKSKLDFKDLPPQTRSFNTDFSDFKQEKIFLLLFLNANSHYVAGKDPFQVPLLKQQLKKGVNF